MSAEIVTVTTAAEREQVYRLRYDIYIDEMHYPYANADHAGRRLADALDATARLLLAREGDQALGTMRIQFGADAPFDVGSVSTYGLDRLRGLVAPAQLAILTRFMIRPEHRAGPLARSMFLRFAELLVKERIEVAFLDCLPHLVNFYTGLGFRPSGPAVNDAISGVLVPMALLLGDHDHLQRVESPLLPVLREGPPGRKDRLERLAANLFSGAQVLSEASDAASYWTQVSGLLEQLRGSRSGILDGLPEETVRSVLARGHLLECAPGDFIARKGLVPRTVFVVLSGTLEVKDGDRLLAVASEGEVVGEIAFLLECPRTSDVVAATQARVLCLNEKNLRSLIEADSRGAAVLLFNLSRSLARKLAVMNLADPRRTSAS
jgi:CRP-like cAMP-binding protein/predicted GNAT family N-acyltransferase